MNRRGGDTVTTSCAGSRPGHHAPGACAICRAYIIYSIRWIWSAADDQRICRENVFMWLQRSRGKEKKFTLSAIKNVAATTTTRRSHEPQVIFLYVTSYILIMYTMTNLERFKQISCNYKNTIWHSESIMINYISVNFFLHYALKRYEN